MPKYLELVADRLQTAIKGDQILLVVLPNQRSRYVLRQLLDQKGISESQVDIWQVDDYVSHLSELELLEPLDLLLFFYQVYRDVERQKAQSFEEFSKWAPYFLEDVNDADMHLVDFEKLASHIRSYQETGAQFTSGPSEVAFRSFWNVLPKYHRALRSALLESGLGYSALLFQRAKEGFEQSLTKHDNRLSGAFWVGFSRFSNAESALLDTMAESLEITVLYDVDRYYVDDRMQEAGLSYRKHSKEIKNGFEPFDLLNTEPRNIEAIGCSGQVAQINEAIAQIDTLRESEWAQTAIIVEDESLLPLLKLRLSKYAERVNFTMGIPIHQTEVHKFIVQWIELHSSHATAMRSGSFYHKSLIQFLNHPSIKRWLSFNLNVETIQAEIRKENMRFVPLSFLKSKFESNIFGQEVFTLLFNWPESVPEYFSKLSDLLSRWDEIASAGGHRELEKQSAKYYEERLKKLFAQLTDVLPEITPTRLLSLIKRHVGGSLVYMAEPMNEALQVMGMLETRNIDFERVIVLGASEDFLPAPARRGSQIPVMHRVQFGMPTYTDTQANNAYQFYRLLQRAKEVRLIYSAVSEGLTSGEPSRYIRQIDSELSQVNPRTKFVHRRQSLADIPIEQPEISVQKTDSVIQALTKAFRQGLSPSALKTYVNSPLEFYMSRVALISEEEEVKEFADASTFGSIVHESLQNLYGPAVGKPLTKSFMKECLPLVKDEVDKQFRAHFSEDQLETGRNLLLRDLATFYVERFIHFEMQQIDVEGECTILHLENRMNVSHQFGDIEVRFKGLADRVDRIGNTVRVIDYKTGGCKPSDLKFDTDDELFGSYDYEKALQLELYRWMVCKQFGVASSNIKAAIFSFKNMGSGFQFLKRNDNEFRENFEAFEAALHSCISEMLDPELAFEHKAETKYASF